MSRLFLESLDKESLSVLNKLPNFRDIGVLGGGTALSLQIGHRRSYDFDIFTHDKFPVDLWKNITEVFGKECEKLLDFEDQLNLKTPEGVNITFFYDDYKLLFKPLKSEFIDLMGIKDIACNIAYILGKRPKWRDYVDIYFLLKEKRVSLDEIVSNSRAKFGTDFSERLFLQQLVYWDDVEDFKIEYLADSRAPEEIKSFLLKKVKAYRDHELSR